MWGCSHGPMSGGWWAGFLPGSLISLLVLGLLILLIVFLAIRTFKPQARGSRGPAQDRDDSEAILKARFAKGEISRDEFIRMNQILHQP